MQDQLETLLLQRPLPTQELTLPSAPNSWEASAGDFVQGMLGNQKPGELDSFLGAALPFGTFFKTMRRLSGSRPGPLKRGDPFGLEPRMDRREFFRRASGAASRDAIKAERDFEYNADFSRHSLDDISNDELYQYFEPRVVNQILAERNVLEKLFAKYMDVDDSFMWRQGVGGGLKGLWKNMTSNFTNEVRQGLTSDAKRALDDNPEKAAEAVRGVFEAVKKRFIR